MTVYLDTSSLVKLYVDEPDADDVQRIVGEADVVATSVLAYPEARAAFARRRAPTRSAGSRPHTLASSTASVSLDIVRRSKAIGGEWTGGVVAAAPAVSQ